MGERVILRRVGVALLSVIAACCVLIAVILTEAHLEMRGITPPLPGLASITQLAEVEGGPIRIRYLNTATQGGPGLSSFGYPAYLIEWADGRSFLVDAGMERSDAEAFGQPIEWLLGTDPIETHGSVAEQLGPAKARISGAAFTHLHSDHTSGFAGLCEGEKTSITVFQTRLQAERDNFGTLPGHADIDEAECAKQVTLGGARMQEVPGFPGLAVVAAGGHSPGSTIFFVRVGDITWVLSGDITNLLVSLDENLPKPLAYSVLIVPENRDRLEVLRLWLHDLDDQPNTIVVPSHDLSALVATGMRPYPILSY